MSSGNFGINFLAGLGLLLSSSVFTALGFKRGRGIFKQPVWFSFLCSFKLLVLFLLVNLWFFVLKSFNLEFNALALVLGSLSFLGLLVGLVGVKKVVNSCRME